DDGGRLVRHPLDRVGVGRELGRPAEEVRAARAGADQHVDVEVGLRVPGGDELAGAAHGLLDELGRGGGAAEVEVLAQLDPVGAGERGDVEAGEVLHGDLDGGAHRVPSAVGSPRSGADPSTFGASPSAGRAPVPRAVRTVRRGPGRGSSSERSLRSPEAVTRPTATASAQVSSPVTSESQVAASVSTTAGGVPRVWRVPGMAWTAAVG